MPDIGVRELKTHASKIIQSIREERARYTVTYRGRPVAILLPVETTQSDDSITNNIDAWDKLIQLGEQIGREWQSPLTSTEILSEMRR